MNNYSGIKWKRKRSAKNDVPLQVGIKVSSWDKEFVWEPRKIVKNKWLNKKKL